MQTINSILPLAGAVQHYDWGGQHFIPELIHVKNTDNQPFAELWMGAHPSAPAHIRSLESNPPLDQYIANQPAEILSEKVATQFQNRLPYLFKVLDVDKMLSIQAHPSKKQAEAGFQRENELGISLKATHRNYKDDNHKPELMVALTDFWLLHGFKSLAAIRATLTQVPEFKYLIPLLERAEIYELYKHIMEMPQAQVNEYLRPLQHRLQKEKPAKEMPDYWAKQAFTDHPPQDGNYDRGIFSIYLFNLLHLQVGEAIFQAAGVPHAYLEGVNVELMANSDNVFRGGLTSKHVDVQELLSSLVFDPIDPQVITGRSISATETIFETPAPDFELRKIEVTKEHAHHCEQASAPHTLIVLSGNIMVNDTFTFQRGDIFFAPFGSNYEIKTNESATIYMATVP